MGLSSDSEDEVMNLSDPDAGILSSEEESSLASDESSSESSG